MLGMLDKGQIAIICENCGHWIITYKITDAEFQKSKEVPLRIKPPVCSVCSQVKRNWKKR